MEKRKTDLTVAGYLVYNKKVLLIHHRKLDLWLPVGGHIDANETPDEALKREFKEEVNLEVEIVNYSNVPKEGNVKENCALPFYTNVHSVGDHDHYCLFYVCSVQNPPQLKINHEVKNAAWFSLQELEQDHIPPDVRTIAHKAMEIFLSLRR